jgi:hypothetical protein
MALPSVPEEREQGAAQAGESLAATAPPPLEATPTEQDEQALRNITQGVEQAAQQPMPEQQQQGYTIKNPYMLLPPNMNFGSFGAGGQRTKTPVERRYDVGLLWEVLANDPQAPEITRIVARQLMGAKK